VLKNLKVSADERIGVDIILRSLESPTRQIVENAGVDGSIVVQNITDSSDYNYGFNAATEKYEDLVKSGVIDPTKVACAALQNAASVATLLLTTDALVSVVPEKKKGGGDTPDMDY
jgi:chaperonin GroEL